MTNLHCCANLKSLEIYGELNREQAVKGNSKQGINSPENRAEGKVKAQSWKFGVVYLLNGSWSRRAEKRTF